MGDGVSTSQPEQLRKRTKRFAIRIVTLFQALPKSDVARTLGRQLLRSGTSVAANYRAVCRARSKAEFIAKMGVVLEEADETAFWLELLIEAKVIPKSRLEALLAETSELVRIFSASRQTAQTRPPKSSRSKITGVAVQSLNHPITQSFNSG
ncbi:MAG TPA: four helix bundle protein [Terriglobia bacterium]|nr:four helix bundle protein [Terriglobia bacterium]